MFYRSAESKAASILFTIRSTVRQQRYHLAPDSARDGNGSRESKSCSNLLSSIIAYCHTTARTMEGKLEAQAVRNRFSLLVDTVSYNLMTVLVPLFEKELITNDIKDEMSLNSAPAKEKATRIVDCVRTQVGIAPSKFPVFTKILRENDGRKAAKALEEEITALRAQGIQVL